MEIHFCRQDSYRMMRQKFTAAWPNLRLELHRQTNFLWKEGHDEIDDDERFFPPHAPDATLFTLSGGTTLAVAQRLFADYYHEGGAPSVNIEPSIYGNARHEITYPFGGATLDENNAPFVLRLNQWPYAEFKRRFTERWTNLSIEIFQITAPGDEQQELPDDFEMNTLTRVNRLVQYHIYERDGVRSAVEKVVNEEVLRDEVYLAALANSLQRSGIVFNIRNNRLGIEWSPTLKQHRLREFQEAGSA